MIRKLLFMSLALASLAGYSQDTLSESRLKITGKLPSGEERLTIGGYAQIDYNQPITKDQTDNGKLDVHRLVMLFGYRFSDRIQFITEIEVEHVHEIYLEQAYLHYKVNGWLGVRAGLVLIPVGIINEVHEPPTFNGVERPGLDTYVVPSTWREIGAGITGNIRPARLKYQLYVINGFLSYDGEARLDGVSGFRNGRQKGIESVIRHPNMTGKVEFYGLKGLNAGFSGYFGKSQSTLYRGIPEEGPERAAADSSVVGTAMLGIDARYAWEGLLLRGQLIYAAFSNTGQYNVFTGSDFGKTMAGFYLEAGYDVFSLSPGLKGQLIPFVRYEDYNTQQSMAEGLEASPASHRREIIAGLGWKPVPGVVVKADYQWYRHEEEDSFHGQFNAGVGIWF